MKCSTYNLVLIICCLPALFSGGSAQQNARISASVFSMGFARPMAGNTVAASIVGQPFVASSLSGDNRLESGFLSNTLFRSPQFFIELIVDDTLTIGQEGSLTLSNPLGFFPLLRQLYFRKGGESTYNSLELPSGDTYTITFPPSSVTERGIEYYLLLSDGSLEVTFPAEDPVEHPAVARVEIDSIGSPYLLSELQYRMISVPVALRDNGLFEMLGDDLGEYNSWLWRLFHFENGAYVEYPDISSGLSSGNAFWLVSRFGASLDFTDALSTSTDAPFEITLQAGWNQVGNPFAFPVDWETVGRPLAVELPSFYDGKEDIPGVAVLQPWEGYWVYNGGDGPASILIPPVESTSAEEITIPGIAIDSETEYRLQLAASEASGQSDRHNYAGFRLAADEGHDALDLSAPPVIDQRLDLKIIQDERPYAVNFKPLASEGSSWDLVVERGSNATATVALSDVGTPPPGFQRYILDLDYRYLVEASDDKFSIQFETAEQHRRLKVIIGTKGYAESVNDGIPLIPIEFALNQNYPNPFNPSTTLEYQIKKLSKVQLEIYNILGQRVRTLVDRSQGAGLYTLIWDGTSDSGTRVASGIYVYRLRAGGFIKSRKMVLVR